MRNMNSSLGFFEVIRVNLKTDEFHPKLQASLSRVAYPHEGI